MAEVVLTRAASSSPSWPCLRSANRGRALAGAGLGGAAARDGPRSVRPAPGGPAMGLSRRLRSQGGLGGHDAGRRRRSHSRGGRGLSRPPGVARGASALDDGDAMAGPRAPSSPTPVGQMGVWLLALAMPIGRRAAGAAQPAPRARGPQGRVPGRPVRLRHLRAGAAVPRRPRGRLRGRALDPHQGPGLPAFWAAQVWLLYTALEPYVRRRWPHMLISWKRLLGGAFATPWWGATCSSGPPPAPSWS